MNKPYIPLDSDSFVPGTPLFSPAELDNLRKKYESSSPSQQPGPRKQIADVINNDEEPAPAAKSEPVVKPEPATKLEPVAAPVFTRIRKKKV